MNGNLKFAAFLCCLLSASILVIAMTKSPPRSGPATPAELTKGARSHAPDGAKDAMALVPIILGELGAIVLMIDSFMRRYESPRGWPIALAVMGLLTLGMTSVIYYAFWGWQPTRPEYPSGDRRFCAACESSTEEQAARGTFVYQGVVGTRLVGAAERCAICGSSIKTMWLFVIIPLIPFGSYRVLPVGDATATSASFISRKTRLNMGHVMTMYSLSIVILGLFGYFATRK